MVPGTSAPSQSGSAQTARSQPAVQAPRPAAQTAALTRSVSGQQCLSELGQAGVNFTPLPDRYLEQGCSNVGTVQLASLPADQSMLRVNNLGPVTCEVSNALAAWARFGADRAARQLLGSPIRSIETMGSYSCRNVAGTNRRSAHSTGAAVDISGFVLEDGRRISVQNGWNGGTPAEKEFLRVVQRSACKRFATVLGPEYNAAHRDHFHFEGVAGSGTGFCR